MTVVQIWSYERQWIGRPFPRPDSEKWLPRITAYAYSKDHRYGTRREDPHHNVLAYRVEFENQPANQSIWRPYKSWTKDELDEEAFIASLYAQCRIPLIHFNEIEYQMPERVLRQFGIKLGIPRAPIDHSELRRQKVHQFHIVDYEASSRIYIQEWHAFQEYLAEVLVIEDNDDPGVTHLEYHSWYHKITRRFIGKPNPDAIRYRNRNYFNQMHAINIMDNAFELLAQWNNKPPEVEAEYQLLLQQKTLLFDQLDDQQFPTTTPHSEPIPTTPYTVPFPEPFTAPFTEPFTAPFTAPFPEPFPAPFPAPFPEPFPAPFPAPFPLPSPLPSPSPSPSPSPPPLLSLH